jgi:hypothetical protein
MEDSWHKVSYNKTKKPETKKLIIDSKNNHKKILCNNILTGIPCTYGNKCLYAHDVEEQNVDTIRKQAYDIVKNKCENIGSIDLTIETELYKNLLVLTKVCDSCINKKCAGGYNCKHGTFTPKYKVCYYDLLYGNCENKDCKYIHLTKFGLKSYNKSKEKENKIINEEIDKICSDIKKEEQKQDFKFNVNYNFKTIVPIGTLLTEEYFLNESIKKIYEDEESGDESNKSEISIDSCDISIFEERK